MPRVIENNVPLPEVLDDLLSSSEQLNAIMNSLTAKMREIEQFLSEQCRVGILVRVPVGEFEPKRAYALAYRKIGSNWRIVVEPQKYPSDGRPWSDCPRDLKMWAVRHLATLLKAIETEIESRIESAEEALCELESVMASLTPLGK